MAVLRPDMAIIVISNRLLLLRTRGSAIKVAIFGRRRRERLVERKGGEVAGKLLAFPLLLAVEVDADLLGIDGLI